MHVYRNINLIESSLRPPKTEITGLLIPYFQNIRGQTFWYKLGTKSNEYFLLMNSKLAQAAKNAAWEEVTVKGYLDLEKNVFEVEKLILTQKDDPILMHANFKEPYEIDAYKRIINQRGLLEPTA